MLRFTRFHLPFPPRVTTALLALATGLVLITGLALAADRDDGEQHVPVSQILDAARIPLDQAVAAALGAQPGTAVEAELEGEISESGTEIFFEVKILDARGEFHEVRLDPGDGRVLDIEREDDPEDAAEREELTKAAARAQIDLSSCIASARKEAKGKVVAATFEADDDELICEALTAGSGRLYEIEVDAADGSVTEVDRIKAVDDDEHEETGEHGATGEREDD